METIDLSYLTNEYLERAATKLNKPEEGVEVRIWPGGLYLFHTVSQFQKRPWNVNFLIELSSKKASLTVTYFYIDFYEDLILDDNVGFPLTKVPRSITDLKKTAFWSNEEVVPFHSDICAMYAFFLKALGAPSKEDFYDDVSDYQDDEPTDFGDASNYDEALVRRIKESLE